jgi:hypothetical protein
LRQLEAAARKNEKKEKEKRVIQGVKTPDSGQKRVLKRCYRSQKIARLGVKNYTLI